MNKFVSVFIIFIIILKKKSMTYIENAWQMNTMITVGEVGMGTYVGDYT